MLIFADAFSLTIGCGLIKAYSDGGSCAWLGTTFYADTAMLGPISDLLLVLGAVRQLALTRVAYKAIRKVWCRMQQAISSNRLDPK
jgi:hypothetical protein